MSLPKITAIILTYNEELHIERCIKSLRSLVEDVVVVDSNSTDNTVQIATALGARILRNQWKNYATQFQWGLDNARITTEWVMRIDADEYFESDADVFLRRLSKLEAEVTGVYIKRKYFFLGSWIRHGSMYPIFVLRLWKNGIGRIENRWMDEHIILGEGQSKIIDANVVDDNKNSISWWIDKHNAYSTREMVDILNLKYGFIQSDEALKLNGESQAKTKRLLKERVYSRAPIFVRSFLYFLYRYFLKFGFLDGTKGFAFHMMQGLWYRSLVDLKILEAENWIEGESDPDEVRAILINKTGLDL